MVGHGGEAENSTLLLTAQRDQNGPVANSFTVKLVVGEVGRRIEGRRANSRNPGTAAGPYIGTPFPLFFLQSLKGISKSSSKE